VACVHQHEVTPRPTDDAGAGLCASSSVYWTLHTTAAPLVGLNDRARGFEGRGTDPTGLLVCWLVDDLGGYR
jgi:hypothetical protein